MTDEPRNLTALQARIRNETNRKARAANTLERLVANVVVGQMLPPGVIKGGTALKVRLGDAHTRFSRDLDAARQAGATLDESLTSSMRTSRRAGTASRQRSGRERRRGCRRRSHPSTSCGCSRSLSRARAVRG